MVKNMTAYHDVPKVDSVIKELENNNPAACYRLSTIVKSKEFAEYCKNDSVAKTDDLGAIHENVLKRLVKNYRNDNVFGVKYKSTVKTNSGMYFFRNQEAYTDSLTYSADVVSSINNKATTVQKQRKDYITFIINSTKATLKKGLQLRASKYAIVADKNNLEELYSIIEQNGTEQDKNFKDLVMSAFGDANFWTEVFCNPKIAELGRDTDFDDQKTKEAIMSDTDEDLIDISDQADEVDMSTKQWDFGNNIKNFTEHISSEVRDYFNGLQKLNSTTITEGKYDVDRSNSIGTPSCHNYQECTIELANIIQNLGGFKSIKDFIDAIRIVAENKREFAAFIKLAKDMEAKPDFANKVYTDLNKYIIDKIRISIDGNGVIKSVQGNNNNSPVRKLYFNLRNDLKGTAIQVNHADVLGEIEQLDKDIDKFVVDENKSANRVSRRGNTFDASKFDELVTKTKYYYKLYFPSINELAIDSFIERNVIKGSYIGSRRSNNLSILSGYLLKVNHAGALSLNEKEQRDYQYRAVAKKNKDARLSFQRAIEAGENPQGYVQYDLPVFDGEYLRGADEILGTLANNLEPYMYSRAELNSRNVENHLNSDLIYNNFITNIAKICGDRQLLNAWVKEKLRSTEYAYSNILIDRPEQGIVGLFRQKPNGDYVLTDYAEQLISPYLLDGVDNQLYGSNADYTKMSDGDYFLTGLYMFSKSLQTYKQYNTLDNKVQAPVTAPFLMRTPSDAPKNFAISMPRYSLSNLWIYDERGMKNYVDNYVKKYIKGASEDIDKSKEGMMVLRSTTVKYDDIIKLIDSANGDKHEVKIMRLMDISPKVGEKHTIVYKVNTPEHGFQYFLFSGVLSKGVDGTAFLEGFTYDGISSFSQENGELARIVKENARNKFIDEHKDARRANNTNGIFNSVRNTLLGELFDYYKALEDVNNSDVENLIEWFHYDLKKGVRDDSGKLTGNAFKFTNLDSVVGVDVNGLMQEVVSFISSTGERPLIGYKVTRDTANDIDSNSSAKLNLSKEVLSRIDDIAIRWIEAYQNYAVNEAHRLFGNFLNEVDDMTIAEYAINSYMTNLAFDDLFEGNSKYYKDAQTHLKRAKECQAGGTSYSIADYNVSENTESPFTQSTNEIVGSELRNGDRTLTFPNGKPVTLRRGWNGVTVRNTIRPSSEVDNLYKKLVDAGVSEAKAKEIARPFGYIEREKGESKPDTTKVNDAQSYITIYEAARRLKILGEYPKYARLIEQLTDDTTDISQINPNELQSFIQVMKNFYFDHYYNNRYGRHLPRQIKNAEFVLVPKFLGDSSLGHLANYMIENDIDQINTLETSKAANYDVLTYWNNDGVVTEEGFAEFASKAPRVKQAFSYMYLYKQQDVPQHMVDAKNKAGIQVMKKVLDNTTSATKTPVNNFIEAYVANIRDDFNSLMDKYNIKFDENYNIINADDPNKRIDYSRVYKLALVEAARLGLDSNMIDYLTVKNENGGTVMPSYTNLVGSKIESIAQSQFNKFITRQKLPGWHGAQVTSVGLENIIKDYKRLKTGETIETDEGKRVELGYHKDGSVVEILLPKWAKSMFNQYDEDGNLVKEISINDVDEEVLKCIGYRIPTEGKQSMAVMKVVGFLPEWMGSTVVVPDEWVTQTGSNFSGDTVYSISYETYLGKDGRVHKVEYLAGEDEQSTRVRYAQYVNRNIGSKLRKESHYYLNDEEKAAAKVELRKIVELQNEDNTKFYRDELNRILEERESDLWEALPEELQEKFKPIFQDKSIKFKERVNQVVAKSINLQIQGYDEQALEDYKQLYKEVKDLIDDQVAFMSGLHEEVHRLLTGRYAEHFLNEAKRRAKVANLITYEEFSKLDVVDQNSRRARNNRIVESMIEIMESPASLEENLARSNFDDISAGIKEVDKMDKSGAVKANVYNPFTQIRFHRNAMSGATLKAFSVARDTGCSIFNATKARLAVPIRVRYGKFVDLNIASEAFNVENGIVYHDRIGNSMNDKNVVGDYITVASSHTTAHILDAIKEGAIKNENEYTFAAFKTLFDIGVDAYSAICWLRQPGISKILEAYYESQSVYVKGNFNPIHTAIKRIARELGLSNIIVDKNDMAGIFRNLNMKFGWNFTKLYPNSRIKFDNPEAAYVNIVDIQYAERRFRLEREGKANSTEALLLDLGAILNFNYINEYGKIISNHIKVLNPDKFGAKQSIYSTRKVFDNMMKLIKDGSADRLKVGDKTLIEAIYPGMTNAIKSDVFDYKEYLKESNTKSVYRSLDVFLRYSTAPSILINQSLLETESSGFINAINELQSYLSGNMNEKLYNEFKKYVLGYLYKSESVVIRNPICIDKQGNIQIDNRLVKEYLDAGVNPCAEEMRRVYGFGYYINYRLNVANAANPTDEEVAEFGRLTPAQKVHYVQQHLSSNEQTVFDFLNVNLFNGFEYKIKGISSQVIRFNDQQVNMEKIYNLFNMAFYNANPLIRLTAIDIIKYAFIVEGYQFKRGAVGKVIKNSALYIDRVSGGTGIVDDVRLGVAKVNEKELAANGIYEDFIRSHSNILHISSYHIERNHGVTNMLPVKGTLGMYYINLATEGGRSRAKEMKLISESIGQDGRKFINIAASYIHIVRGKKTILHAVDHRGDGIYIYPLNKLEANESGEFSANPKNNIHLSKRYYQELICATIDKPVSFSELREGRHRLFDKNVINGYGYKKFTSDEKAIVPNDPLFLTTMALQEPGIAQFIQSINKAFENSRMSYHYVWNGNQRLQDAFQSLDVNSVQKITDSNGNVKEYLIKRVYAAPTKRTVDNPFIENVNHMQKSCIQRTGQMYVVKPVCEGCYIKKNITMEDLEYVVW